MPNIESLLIEGGLAGVFALFAILMTREFMKYIKDRDEQVSNTLSKVAENLAKLTEVVENLCREIDRLKEKTRPRAIQK